MGDPGHGGKVGEGQKAENQVNELGGQVAQDVESLHCCSVGAGGGLGVVGGVVVTKDWGGVPGNLMFECFFSSDS